MGATSSSPSSVTPILPATVSALTAKDVADQVRELGKPYAGYAEKIEENGLDGSFLEELTVDDLPGIFADIGVESMMHQKKLSAVFRSIKSESHEARDQKDYAEGAAKKFGGFLSHFKRECGTEARLVQLQMKPILQKQPIVAGGSSEVFLDSDDLSDLRNLLQHVKETQVLVLLQSKGVLTRPWVILELHTAIKNRVPIVALNVRNAFPYDYAAASEFLLNFDKDIELANPGAAQLLIDMGIDPVDVAYRLSDCLPNIISTNFNPNASEKILQASLEDLSDAMRKASPIAPSMGKEEWLANRLAQKPKAVKRKPHGSTTSDQAVADTGSSTVVLAEVPSMVPELPGAYLVRDEDLSLLKAALLADDGANGTALTAMRRQNNNKVGAHGMVSVAGLLFT